VAGISFLHALRRLLGREGKAKRNETSGPLAVAAALPRPLTTRWADNVMWDGDPGSVVALFQAAADKTAGARPPSDHGTGQTEDAGSHYKIPLRDRGISAWYFQHIGTFNGPGGL
jgi:hypothetical protein